MPKIVAQKKDWLKLGYQLFSQEGIKGIVVEKMAQKLQCNKSSFYWHFASKENFMDKLIDYWVQTETNQIIEEVEAQKTAKQKYHRFVDLVFQYDPYLEFIFHLKRYAKKRTGIRQLIHEVDERRMAFTAHVFQELGYDKKEAQQLASIFYKYLIGYHEMYREQASEEQNKQIVKEELAYILKRRF